MRSVLKTPIEVENWFQGREGPFAFDWETSGLNYLKMEPVGISFCDGEDTCYIDLWQNEDHEELCNILATILQHGTFIAHNLKYDWKCCTKFLKAVPKDYFCTFIAAFLLDENRSSHSLDSLAECYFGTSKAGKWQDYTDWHSEEFYEYAMVDSELCYRLYELQLPQLKEQDLEHVFKIEMDFVPVAAEIEMNGILVDQTKLSELQAKVCQKIVDCEDEMLALVGKKAIVQKGVFGQEWREVPINFNSDAQIVTCLLHTGLTLTEKTKTGKYCVAKHVLSGFKDNPFVDALQEYNTLQKLLTSYILPAWEMIDADGRIRPNIGIVKTGRTSMSSPNLQQLPNVKDETINYREIFTTLGTLIGADYSGQELRILGEVTQDDNIIQAFASGWDLHLLTAKHIFDLPIGNDALVDKTLLHKEASRKYKVERSRAKGGANFPIVYGSSASGIAWRQGVTKDEAEKWVEGFFKAYPKVKAAMDLIPNRLYEKGFLTTLMGRRRRFPGYRTLPQYAKGKFPSKDRCVRQGFNFLIQGFAADQAKIAGRMIYDAFKKNPRWGARVILLIHDEYVAECDTKYLEEVKKCMIGCMENAVSLSVKFTVDCKCGQNYSEIK